MSKSALNVPRIVVTDNDYDDDNEEQATTINVESDVGSDSDEEIKRRIRPNSLRFDLFFLF